MHRHTSGETMVEELLRLGIDTIELGHGLKITQVEGILKVFERGDVKISSVHNFCPHPMEIPGDSPDCYEFTSHRDTDRRRATKLTSDTIELAARLKARAVVLHGGRVRTMRCYRKALEMIENGEFLTKAYGDMKIEALAAREESGPKRLERLRAAIDHFAPRAAELGILLGLENRERYEDVPSEREMLPFLNRCGHPNLGYWHDFGHAQIKHNMAFLNHKQWLESAAPRLVGCHVHDVSWPNLDHQPPFSGEVPFLELVPLLPSDVPVVFEMNPDAETDAVLASRKRWQQTFES